MKPSHIPLRVGTRAAGAAMAGFSAGLIQLYLTPVGGCGKRAASTHPGWHRPGQGRVAARRRTGTPAGRQRGLRHRARTDDGTRRVMAPAPVGGPERAAR